MRYFAVGWILGNPVNAGFGIVSDEEREQATLSWT